MIDFRHTGRRFTRKPVAAWVFVRLGDYEKYITCICICTCIKDRHGLKDKLTGNTLHERLRRETSYQKPRAKMVGYMESPARNGQNSRKGHSLAKARTHHSRTFEFSYSVVLFLFVTTEVCLHTSIHLSPTHPCSSSKRWKTGCQSHPGQEWPWWSNGRAFRKRYRAQSISPDRTSQQSGFPPKQKFLASSQG